MSRRIPYYRLRPDYQKQSNSLYQQIVTGTAIKILAPAKSMIKKISEVDGVVEIGESKSIDVTVSGKENNLYAGELENLLTVVTNDPKNSSFNFVLKANVTGDLHAKPRPTLLKFALARCSASDSRHRRTPQQRRPQRTQRYRCYNEEWQIRPH